MSESEHARELKRAIDEGFTFEGFLRSAPGRFLCARAEREREQLVNDLVACDPDDVKCNRELRARIAVIDAWQQWMAEAISEGQNAQEQFVALEGST